MDAGLFEQIVERLDLGVAVVDQSYRVVTWNGWLVRATGLPAQVACGRHWRELFPSLGDGPLDLAIRAAIENGHRASLLHAAHGRTFPLSRDAGGPQSDECLPHDVKVLPLTLGGRPHCLLQVNDVSAAAQREQQLGAAVIEARQARAAQREFLAHMSHEIRTPMNGILALCELLLLEETSTEHRETLEVIHRSSHALLSVLNDVLDFSKIDAGKMTIHRGVSDVRRLTREVLGVLVPRARDKALLVRAEVDDAVPVALLLDELRLRQVLLNLVSNAIKFTEQAGSVTLALAWDSAESRGSLRCSVTDTGVGIADPEKLFREYVQGDATISRRFGGTGLGLAISKQLVELMGGQIRVESRVGHGSRFWFDVPAEVASELLVEPMPASGTVAKAGVRVLVVDDNPVNQLVACRILQQMGHHVSTADDGWLAVQAMQQSPFDVVLMDCLMPVMDGYEATRLLRRSGFTDVPIVAVTAGALEGEREACLEAGMTDYVTKPLTLHAIAALLERLRPKAACA